MFKLHLKASERSKYKSPSIHRTPLYRAKAAYTNMLARCENANGKNPAYAEVELRITLKEWLDWSLPKYEKFNLSYPNSSPSVSRFKDKGHYEIGNIEIIPLKINKSLRGVSNRLNNGSKFCSKCKKTKNISEFNKRKSSLDGYNQNCRECTKKLQMDLLNAPGAREARNRKRKEKRRINKLILGA